MNRFEGISEVNSDGKIEIHNRKEIDLFFKQNKNKRFQFTFTEVEKSKTREQLGYYYACIIPRCKKALIRLGNSFDDRDTHELLKKQSPVMFETIVHDGKEFIRERSLSDEDFTIKDMKQYIDDVIRFAAEELEIEIPDPK